MKQKLKSIFSVMSIVDFLLVFVFGICLPSTDVYSDLTVIIKLSGASPHRAMTLACPMIFSTLFVLPQWWHLEQSTFKKIVTFPFVLIMFYPQYKMIQILYFGLWAKDNRWKEQKDIIERNVSSIGKILLQIITQDLPNHNLATLKHFSRAFC